MKRIALLGGTRFIGSHLLESLYKEGYQITIFNRGVSQPPFPLPEEVEVITGNRNRPRDYQKLFYKDFDVVIDLSGYNENHILPIVRNYKSRIGHYIFCSTPIVCIKPPSGFVDEESPRDFTRNTYGGDKALAEELLLREWDAHKWPVTILRPNGVFGPYDYGRPTRQVWLAFYRLINSIPFPVINEKKPSFSLLYVDDLVNAFIQAMNNENSHGNVYGVAGDEILSELSFLEICGEVCSHDPEILFVEDLGYDGAHLMHPWPEEGALVTDNAKIKTDFAINFTSLKTALSKTYSWLTSHPEHFGRPSFRGERYALARRPIPRYVKLGWKLIDQAIFILRSVKQYFGIVKGRFLEFFQFIKK